MKKLLKRLNSNTVVYRFADYQHFTGELLRESVVKWTGTRLIAEKAGVELRTFGEGQDEHFVVSKEKIALTYSRGRLSNEDIEQFKEVAQKWAEEKKDWIEEKMVKTKELYEREEKTMNNE